MLERFDIWQHTAHEWHSSNQVHAVCFCMVGQACKAGELHVPCGHVPVQVSCC